MELRDEIKLVREFAIDVAREWSLSGILENIFLIGESKGRWTVIGSTKERGNKGIFQMMEKHSKDIDYYDTCHIIDKNNPDIQLKYIRKASNDLNKSIDYNPMYA